MRIYTSLRYLILLFILVIGNKSWAQQSIGTFPSMDGGFEGLTANPVVTSSIATGTQTTLWTVSTSTGTATTYSNTGGRSGNNYVTFGSPSSGNNKRLQSPTASNAAIVSGTQYVVQYFYRTSAATAPTNAQVGINPDGTGGTITYTAVTLSGTSGAWTKMTQTFTPGASAASPRYGIGILRYSNASAISSYDVDDFVIYAGSTADVIAPNSPGSVSVNNATTSSLDVSWGAASGGVDGGGYVVVRYATSPNTDNDPNQNGIYAVNNTTTNGTGSLTGTFVYIGTGTSFTDNGLTQGTTYYYKVYTVDKAFNYSAESQGSGTTSVPATPAFTFVGTPLSTFNATFGTPSAQQSYTISGSNLTINQTNGISVTAPANFEVSLTSNTFTGTNGNTVTLSSDGSGNIVGQPVTIYVRYFPSSAGNHSGSITHSGAGVSPSQNVSVSGVATGYYYSKSSGDLNSLSTWGTATDGTGTAPLDFTSSNQTFEIRNQATPTITAPWTVSGSSSKIVVTNGVDFTIPSSSAVSGTIDVNNGGELTLANSSLPTFGTLASGSTIEYAQSSTTSILNTTSDAVTYSNLKLSGSGTKTLKGNTTTVTGNLTYDGSTNGALTLDAAASSPFSTIQLGGDLTYLGTVTSPVDINSYTLTATGNGTQTITGNGNVARFFKINTGTSGSNVVLGTGTNTLLGNASTAAALTLNTGTTLTIGSNTLTFFAGGPSISGAGTITGSPASNITINRTTAGTFGTLNFTQTSASTRSLNDLVLNTVSVVTLGNALDVYGTITLTGATFHLAGKNLTLKSDASNTARIADLNTSTLDGATNVTVERYIKLRTGGTGRAYRLLAPTVNTTGTINANWQEGQSNSSIGTYVNTNPGYGTHITGAGGSSNGFDVTASNAPSLYLSTNGITPTYTAIANTNATNLNALTGYYLYVRGDRSVSTQLPLTTGMPTTATTLRTTGTLLQGDISSFTNAFDITNGAMNLVTNPYPSPIDWNLMYPSNVTNVAPVYTAWDPNLGTRGGYVTVTVGGVATPPESGANQFIQSGQAFYIQSTGAGGVVCNLHENQKSAGNNNNIFRITPAAPESFSASLFFKEPDGYRRLADGVRVLYDNSYKAAVDGNDAREISNWDENIAIDRANTHLAMEFRPVIKDADTIPLFMSNMRKMDYEFQFIPTSFSNTSLKAELVDKFLGTRTLLSVKDTVVVPFSITADAASTATDRFMIVFGAEKAPVKEVDHTKPLVNIYPNPINGKNLNVNFNGLVKGNYSLTVVDNSGNTVMNTSFYHDGSVGSKNFSLPASITAGQYFVRVLGSDSNISIKVIIQ